MKPLDLHEQRAADLRAASIAPSKAARRIQRRNHLRQRSRIDSAILMVQVDREDKRQRRAEILRAHGVRS